MCSYQYIGILFNKSFYEFNINIYIYLYNMAILFV
jgi:hypothetical protein